MTTDIDPRQDPVLGTNDADLAEARAAVDRLVSELQAGIDQHDADIYNRHFAHDVTWGSPHGEIVVGYDDLHAIHTQLQLQAKQDSAMWGSSRYEVVHVAAPAPGVALAHVRRLTLDPDGTPRPTEKTTPSTFSEMALYVLIRHNGTWWLAAGQNTIIGQ